MKKILAVLLVLAGICSAAAAINLSMNNINAKPVLLTPPDEARNKVVMLMDAFCEGDYEKASQAIYGNPGLGVDRDAGSEVGILVWRAFQDSISYELAGECYTTDQGIAQDVTVTCLDITSITDHLRDNSQSLLEQRVEEAEDVDDVYDENNEYREDFVMGVLFDATEKALEKNARMVTLELTINLSYQNGQWWVVADEALLDAISGGILY